MEDTLDGMIKPHSKGVALVGILFVTTLLAGCGSSKHERRPASHPMDRDFRAPSVEEYRGEQKLVYASWYGKDFHGRPTASGEPFDMHALTCAHREYPFGTLLRVGNPRTGREVDCTINDRGPFIAGRDLDMSYGAARRVDLIGPGVAQVSIEPVGRDLRYIKTVKYSGSAAGTVTIQTGSFREVENARRLKLGLEFHYNNVYITEAVVNGQTFYRVRIGKFASRSEARQAGLRLANEGYEVLIATYE
ncbi:MAG TPA: septal ring lytic transglycosylase RlpA family protein [Dissulfurispiraceae bacterium]|nr:septal ring lytic transglycosylase RlpA family protein [Dissulfurispiraceae bacterium]